MGVSRKYPNKRKRPKVIEVKLFLTVENNSKFVRGKTKVREDIENYVLSNYDMKKPYKDSSEYILKIPYLDETDLEKKIYDIYDDMDFQIGGRHCFIEADIINPFTGYGY